MNAENAVIVNCSPTGETSQDDSFSRTIVTLDRTAEAIVTVVKGQTSVNSARIVVQNTGDMFNTLQSMRRSRTQAVYMLDSLISFLNTMDTRTGQLRQYIKKFNVWLLQASFNYGLNLLLDEILLDILWYTAADVVNAVTLLHVCKRFQSLVVPLQKMWRDYWIEARWPSDQILTIAKRSDHQSLKTLVRGYIEPASLEAILSLLPYFQVLDIVQLRDNHTV